MTANGITEYGLSGQSLTDEDFLINNWRWSERMAWSPDNVTAHPDGGVTLTLDDAPNDDGAPYQSGAVRSVAVASEGTWSWVAQAPDMVDGAVFAMFLYRENHGLDPWLEYDFEFVGEDTTKVQLTVHMENAAGEHITNMEPVIIDLGFDASEGEHLYEIVVGETSTDFRVDGITVRTFSAADMPGNVWLTGDMRSITSLWPATDNLAPWTGYWDDPDRPLVADIDAIGTPAHPIDEDLINEYTKNTGGTTEPEPAPEPEPVVVDEALHILGGKTADKILGGTGDDSISGGIGSDTIYGGDGDDQLYGNTALDTIYGGGGDDFITSGDGVDYVEGGTGNDTIYGRSGWDSLFGDDGDDKIFGNSGDDEVHAGAGNDWVSGGSAGDLIYGDSGDDVLLGNIGSDIIWGGADNDTLRGGSGDDSLHGGTGDDRLFGNQGVDRLEGGAGDDLLRGGTLVDTFVFDVGHDADRISDFELVNDRLELSSELVDGLSDAQDIIDTFGRIINGKVVFLFGDGDSITLSNLHSLTDLNALEDNIFIT